MSHEHEIICRDFVERLLQYLSGELPPEDEAVFERHLGECPSCVAYMKTYQQAVKLARAALAQDEADAPMPEDLAGHLVKALLASRGQ